MNIFSIILERNNDLTEFFWPLLYFAKKSVLVSHQIPLWNNLFLAGTPLAPDPQNPIFYPLNIFALFLPLDWFFILSFIFHIILGWTGMYFLSQRGFKFSPKTSLILAFLYSFSPKLAAYLEAGHVGLIYSLAFTPWVFLSAILIRTKRKISYSIIFAITLSLLYFSHLPTFLIVISATFIFINQKSFKYFLIGIILTLGLTAISLLPQVKWQKYSTRYLLLEKKDVYPKWKSKTEAIKALLIPNLDTEKAITIGIAPLFLSAAGFLKLKRKQKVFTAFLLAGLCLLIFNNVSPIYPILLQQKWFLLLRVATRFWILINLILLYLIGLSIERYRSKFFFALAILAMLELLLGSIKYLQKPINKNLNMTNKEIYEYLSKDKSLFRVYCLTRCLSQKQAAIYGLELLDGYSTVQQNNFFKHSWQLTGSYWNYYTLSIPPIGTYLYEKPQPKAKPLGRYAVKYLISPYELTDSSFVLKEKIGNFLIYENCLSVPRNYEIYTPNEILVRVDSPGQQLIIPEVYNSGWKAYLNGNSEVPVLETPNALRAVDTLPSTNSVVFKYHPEGYGIGQKITFVSLAIIFGYGATKIFKRPDTRT